MEIFFISQGIILVVIILLIFLLSFVWPPDSPWSPWWKTSVQVSRVVCDIAKITNKDVLYELGSGNGTTLMIAAKEYGARCVGVEIDPIRYWYSKFVIWKSGLTKKVTLYQKNFLFVPIGSASVIYIYLVPKAIKKLKEKFLSELKPGTRVVSYHYKIPYLQEVAFEKSHKIHVYIIPHHK